MRNKRRNTNIKILQNQLQNLASNLEDTIIEVKKDIKGSGIVCNISATELPIVEKLPKKRGIPKNELINTKRLLTC